MRVIPCGTIDPNSASSQLSFAPPEPDLGRGLAIVSLAFLINCHTLCLMRICAVYAAEPFLRLRTVIDPLDFAARVVCVATLQQGSLNIKQKP